MTEEEFAIAPKLYWSQKVVRFNDGRGSLREIQGLVCKEICADFCTKNGIVFIDRDYAEKPVESAKV